MCGVDTTSGTSWLLVSEPGKMGSGRNLGTLSVREPIVLYFEARNGNFRARPTFWWVSCPDWSLEVTENLLQLLISGMLQCSGVFFSTFVDRFAQKEREIVDLGLNCPFLVSKK